jgi:hypothetical protein
MVTTEDLYRKTNNGLDIIYYFYPQARACVEGTSKHFKLRAERTPSATIKQIGGVWKVTDFGDEGRALSPIDICMHEKNLSFRESLFFLAREFNVDDNAISKDINKAKIQKRPATEDEEEGHFNYELNDEFTKTELLILGPKVRQSDCDALSWNSVKWYSTTKMGETTIITATETYPIFMRKCQYYEPDGKTLNHFYKVYQPLNPDKGFRFFYKGIKPKMYVCGLFELKALYNKYNEQLEKDWETSEKRKDGDVFKPKKIEEAFICCGERDALCVKALNYTPLWFNSESYNLSESEYYEITKYVDRLYSIPDIDPTGIDRGIKLASKFIDIYTAWLPDQLRTYKDRRGNPRKDFRDFCEIWPEKKRFRGLLNMAMPYRFWEYKQNENGQRRLELVTDYAMYFLRCSGFHSLEDKNSKSGKMFIYVEKNIVREIKGKDIRAYFRKFVRKESMPVDVRELVNNTTKLSETSLDNLDEVEVNFTSYTSSSQFFFFKNAVWEVSSEKITEHKEAIDRYVWASELIDHNIERLSPAFEIKKTQTEDGQLSWDIQITEEHNSNFFRFLINTSRMFWRKEIENPRLSPSELEEYCKRYKFVIDGPELSDIEIAEQKHHLVNKIFCIGYLMHRYKAENRSWCIYAIDNKNGRIDDSNGGTGKSFCFKTPRLFMQSVTLSGRSPKMTENKHLFENVTEHTKYILVDDADSNTPFSFFFDIVTGDLTVNPKNTKSYAIPFERSPKFCITSNFVLRNIDPSTSRRILYAVFSDYYHEKTSDNGYKETRTIYDDFRKNLFREGYTEEEWNADINFLVECCRFYLSVIKDDIKLQPPMANVISRTLRGIMGENFLDWAQVYFHEKSDNCNKLLPRQEVFDDFKTVSGLSRWTPNKFTKAMKAYCEYDPNIIALNPEELQGTDGRIIKQYNGKSTEMFYVQTKKELNIELDYKETPEGTNEIQVELPY